MLVRGADSEASSVQTKFRAGKTPLLCWESRQGLTWGKWVGDGKEAQRGPQ